MNPHQRTALDFPCRLAVETRHARFQWTPAPGVSLVLTVNSGWE